MKLREAVNAKVDTTGLRAAGTQAISSFMTPQTLVTFPGASMVIAVTDKIIDQFVSERVANEKWPLALIAIAVGAFLVWMSLTDPALNLQVAREQFILSSVS